MKTIPKTFALIIACSLAACSTVTVTTDYDHSAPFGTYKTYSLAPAAHDQTLAPTGEAVLRDSLRSDLAARGITEVARGNADLNVVRHVFLQQKLSVQQYTDYGYGYGYGYGRGWPYRYGYYGMWAGAPRTYTNVNQYTEGTLVLDFVDARTKRLVFRGVGKAVVGAVGTNSGKIREAVAEIVDRLPVGASH